MTYRGLLGALIPAILGVVVGTVEYYLRAVRR